MKHRMSTSVRRRTTLLMLLVAAASVACSADDPAELGEPTSRNVPATDAAATAPDDVELLYALRGPARLDGDRLSITAEPDTISWVSDRPERRAGVMDVKAFLASWQPVGFDEDPPNAILMTDSTTVEVELTEPAAGATADELVVTVAPLDDVELPAGDLGAVELFIDDASAVVDDCSDAMVTFIGSAPGFPGNCWEVLNAMGDSPFYFSAMGLEWSCWQPSSNTYVCQAPENTSLYLSISFLW